eukprot:TRINITY_DN4912_c0_g1_i2.p1 TRINITY_DN4912_c0_g1~~TRINITY_DN4912_c0_g1_i2.p1  ORF type:complete len:470 (+),score=96.92 TRINITY_DN4912_c0_g1_i2:46-1410(+)
MNGRRVVLPVSSSLTPQTPCTLNIKSSSSASFSSNFQKRVPIRLFFSSPPAFEQSVHSHSTIIASRSNRRRKSTNEIIHRKATSSGTETTAPPATSPSPTPVPPVFPVERNFSSSTLVLPDTINETQKMISLIEKKLGFPFFVFYSQENGSLCKQDGSALQLLLEERLRNQKQKNGEKFEKVGLFLKSNGGDVDASFRMLSLLKNYSEQFVVFVVEECSSAATMLSLGADMIYMGKGGYLSAIDVSVRNSYVPSKDSINTLETSMMMKMWTEAGGNLMDLTKHIHPLAISAAMRANYSSKIKPLLKNHVNAEDALDEDSKEKKMNEMWEKLNSGPSHTYPIPIGEAKSLGLRVSEVSSDLESMLVDLTQIYRHTASARVSYYNLEYLHKNEILNVHETIGKQIFYQVDLDQFKSVTSNQTVLVNVKSSWKCKTNKTRSGKVSLFISVECNSVLI